MLIATTHILLRVSNFGAVQNFYKGLHGNLKVGIKVKRREECSSHAATECRSTPAKMFRMQRFYSCAKAIISTCTLTHNM